MASFVPFYQHLTIGCLKPSLRTAKSLPNLRRDAFTFTVGAGAGGGEGWEREEQRWLREEQRWLREEQRWLREERRWLAEREELLAEIAALRIRLQQPAAGPAVQMVAPMPALAEKGELKEMVLEEARFFEHAGDEGDRVRRRTLRKGTEGADVRAMQEALQKLGFYSGEEDIEFSSFSSGTERAVKTWQASLGSSQDGIMTADLLELLYAKKTGDAEEKKIKDGDNGSAVAPVIRIADIQQTTVEATGDSAVGVTQHRVFLLGENRWEEPSRLYQKEKLINNSSNVVITKKCLSCRGEGRLLCTECDGTGEPNIEPQFLEWVEEGTKCPYCNGLGYTICDVCEGKAVPDT